MEYKEKYKNYFYETKFDKNYDNLSYCDICKKEQQYIDAINDDGAYKIITEDLTKMINNTEYVVCYSAYLKALIKAVIDLNVKATVCLNLSVKDKILNYCELEKFYLSIKNISPKVNFAIYCKDIFCNEQDFSNSIKLCLKYKLPLYVGAGKSLDEMGKCAQLFNNKTPIQVLEDLGVFECHATIIHCNYLEDGDFLLLSKYNAEVCATFSNDMNFGLGATNVISLLKNNIKIKLGTGQSYNFNMINELELCKLMQKYELKDAKSVNKNALINMIK